MVHKNNALFVKKYEIKNDTCGEANDGFGNFEIGMRCYYINESNKKIEYHCTMKGCYFL